SRRLNASNLFLSLILHLGNLFLIVQLHFSKLFLILKSGVNHTSRGSISTSTLPSIKLRKCSSKIITSILSFISGRLATKSNQIKQLIRNGRSASLQRTFKKSFTSFSHSTRNKTRDGLIRVRNIRALNVSVSCAYTQGKREQFSGFNRTLDAINNVFRKFSAFHDETGRLNVDGMNIISNDGINQLNRSRKARVSYKVLRTINASLNAATSTRAVSSNPNFVTCQKIEIIFG